jgi:hypothetical protein
VLDPEKLARTLRHVATLLVAGEYAELARETNGQQLTAEELEQAVVEYGHRLVPPPNGVWEARSIIEVEGATPEAWSIYVDLWTADEGRADLTLELTLRESERDTYDVEIDNLHVL